MSSKRPTISAMPAPSGTGSRYANQSAKKTDNPYTHDTSNTVPSSSKSNFDKIKLNTQFQPNVLDNYDAVTYHWKMFMVTPEAASAGAVFNQDDQTIIAESGVTDLTIDNVEIIGITAPSVESGTGVMTNVKFDITEPSGAGMIDKMFYQSIALGIGNWATMPVYLQLTFKARDATDSSPDDGSPSSLSGLTWLWAMKITSTKARVTHVGTKYEFVAILYDDFAQSNVNFSLTHNTTLNDIDKFGTAMKELEEKLNADQLMKLLNNYSIPDTYRIIVDPKLANAKITPDNKNTNSRRNDNFVTFENKDATFLPGTGVDKIIDTLLAQTDKFQKELLNAQTPGADGEPMNVEKSQMKKFWRIITETRPTGFDAKRLTSANEFTIYIVEYDIGVLDNVAAQSSAGPLTIEAERKRYQTYVDKSILKKKYNYIFTGLNDQIIDFDLTINNAFTVALSRLGGIYQNTAMSDKGPVMHNHAAEETKVSDAIGKAIALQNNSKTTNTAESQRAYRKATDSIQASNLPDETKSRYAIILSKSRPADRTVFFDNTIKSGGIGNDGTLKNSSTSATNLAKSSNRLTSVSDVQQTGSTNIENVLDSTRRTATGLAKSTTERITNQQFNFISNVDVTSAEARAAYTEFAKNSQGKLRPIARTETAQDRQIGMGVESSSNSGIQKLSSMFSVALHSGLDASFQRIKMTIKGDPFWLFPQPITDKNTRIYKSLLEDQQDALTLIKKGHQNLIDSANTYSSDNFLLLRFRTPRVYNQEDDEASPNIDIETFSGVFKVLRVTSRFVNGKFTQELECILDPEIRILNIADQIEEDAGRTSLASPTTLVQEVTLEDIPSKTPKLATNTTSNSSNQIPGFSPLTKSEATYQSVTQSLGKSSINFGANIPTSKPNIIPGLPNTFG